MEFVSLRWIYNRLVPTLLVVLSLFGLWLLGQQSEHWAYDLLNRWSAHPSQHSKVTLILIDDESIERLRSRFGQVPWPRKVYVELFNRIQALHPKLMVLDGHFININESEDAEVFKNMRQFHNLITGLVMNDTNQPDRQELNTDLPQYYRLNLGVVSMRQDEDGTIRQLKPIYQVRTSPKQTGIFPALSLAAAYEYVNLTHPGSLWIMDVSRANNNASLMLYPERKPYQGLNIPMTGEDAFYVHWYQILNKGSAEYARSHQAIPLWQLWDPAYQHQIHLEDQIALIGSSSTFYRDYHRTPVALRHLGPDIHATAIDNILNGEAIRKAPAFLNFAILLALAAGILAIRLKMRHLGRTLLYTLGTMIIYCWLVFFVFSQNEIWLDIVTPELFMLLSFMAGSTFRVLFKEKQLDTMERTLAQLVDPDVFKEIQQKTDVLKPGGAKQEITSMFVDIRNFTAFAEHIQPGEVTELLNEFYQEVVKIIFAHAGTIDKFMGDGILIMFGAPIPSQNHRQQALSAARALLEATHKLSQRWEETKNLQTDIGISVNSGPAFVGFLGPANKLEYTAVGDTVNLCVRLQEVAKQHQTRLVIGESTTEGWSPDGLVPLGETGIRGREGSIKIYTLQTALATPMLAEPT